jgi:CBS domain containing-hemolysin-like protein
VTLLLAVIFLLGNAFFVGAQFALITTRRDQIEPLAAKGGRAARVTLHQLRVLPPMLAGSQLGIAACSLGLGAVAEPGLGRVLEWCARPLDPPDAVIRPVALIVALILVAFCHMVLGEMVPKNLALAGPVRAALWLGPPMAAWVQLTRPVLVVVNGAANLIVRLFGVAPKTELGGAYTAEELSDIFTESTAAGLLDREEQRRLQAALRIERTTARDLLTPLGRVVTLARGASARDVEQLVRDTGLSRFPVRDGTRTDGQAGGRMDSYVHAKDVLGVPDERFDDPLPASLYRRMITVAPAAPVAEVLTAMRRSSTHLVRVEHGGRTLGIVSLETVVRTLVAT